MEHWTEYTRFFIALFVILDPFAAVPIFLALTKTYSTSERGRIANINGSYRIARSARCHLVRRDAATDHGYQPCILSRRRRYRTVTDGTGDVKWTDGFGTYHPGRRRQEP